MLSERATLSIFGPNKAQPHTPVCLSPAAPPIPASSTARHQPYHLASSPAPLLSLGHLPSLPAASPPSPVAEQAREEKPVRHVQEVSPHLLPSPHLELPCYPLRFPRSVIRSAAAAPTAFTDLFPSITIRSCWFIRQHHA